MATRGHRAWPGTAGVRRSLSWVQAGELKPTGTCRWLTSGALILPEILESLRAEFRVSDCVRDVAVPHVVLDASGINALVG
jgi:hypothetical protein